MHVYALNFWGETATDLLQSALDYWNTWYTRIISILQVPITEAFDGTVWDVVTGIMTVIEGTGITLLVIFYLYGLIKSSISYQDFHRHPKQIIFSLFRLLIAKFFVTYASDILLGILSVAQNLIRSINATVTSTDFQVPDNLKDSLAEASWAGGMGACLTALLLHVIIFLLAVILCVMVYARFFKIYLMATIAPIPLAGFASEQTESFGVNYLKSYTAECLRGILILAACMIFTAFAASPAGEVSGSPGYMTLFYGGGILLQMLLLVIVVRASDRMVKEIFGL